jgi:hypothetical protein
VWTGEAGNVPNFEADATALAGGSAVVATTALSILEDFISGNYGGLGVIHMTRGAAEALASRMLLESRGGQLFTRVGTPVVAGSGYPGTGPAGASGGAGQTWIMASPAIFGYRSDIFTTSSRSGDTLDRTTNDLTALAERTYLLGYDPCGVGAVLTQLGEPVAPPVADPETGPLMLLIGTVPGSPVSPDTDVTVHVQANKAPTDEVHLWVSKNGDPVVDLGEMTEIGTTEFVYNQETSGAASGDSYALYATSGSTTSPTITVDVT